MARAGVLQWVRAAGYMNPFQPFLPPRNAGSPPYLCLEPHGVRKECLSFGKSFAVRGSDGRARGGSGSIGAECFFQSLLGPYLAARHLDALA